MYWLRYWAMLRSDFTEVELANEMRSEQFKTQPLTGWMTIPSEQLQDRGEQALQSRWMPETDSRTRAVQHLVRDEADGPVLEVGGGTVPIVVHQAPVDKRLDGREALDPAPSPAVQDLHMHHNVAALCAAASSLLTPMMPASSNCTRYLALKARTVTLHSTRMRIHAARRHVAAVQAAWKAAMPQQNRARTHAARTATFRRRN